MDYSGDHPLFTGNRADLDAFMRLASSRPRSEERQQALLDWEHYKQAKQVRAYIAKTGRRLNKGHAAYTSRVIDLTGATLDDIWLGYADLRGVILDNCSLRGARFKGARLENASLKNVDWGRGPRGPGLLTYADLRGADLSHANLVGVDLSSTLLSGADLTGANLTNADLRHALMVGVKVKAATLDGALVYGTSAWDVEGTPRSQRDLTITPSAEASLTVDDLSVAQFVYLMLDNPNIRRVIDTMVQRGVLLLGRFTPERKQVLDAIRVKLRELGYLPMLFDFEKPSSRDLEETVRILAGMSRFIIADLTDPSSVSLETRAVVPDLMVPFVPILAAGQRPFSMLEGVQHKSWWVLDVIEYASVDALTRALDPEIVQPALAMERRIQGYRAEPKRPRRLIQ